MAEGWLQRDVHVSSTQRIGVRPGGLDQVEAAWTWPLWFKVTARKVEGRIAEVAVQAYGDASLGRQLYYGRAITSFSGDTMVPVTVPMAWDWGQVPEDPEGQVGWPQTLDPAVMWLSIEWADLAADFIEETVYRLHWWFDMLHNFTSALKTQLDLLGWTGSVAAGYAAPDDVVLMVDDDLGVQDIKAKLGSGLAVIHSPVEVEAEDGFQGSPRGREGRVYQVTISLLARTQSPLSGSEKEPALLKVSYLAEDVKQLLDPSGETANLLAGFLYFSRLDMGAGPYRADVDGIDGSVARVDLIFTGYKLQLEGEAESEASGDGVVFSFSQPFVQGDADKTQNDHTWVFTPATNKWHQIGIYCTYGEWGSAYFFHLTYPDLRAMTIDPGGGLHIGAGGVYTWRHLVWAPHVIPNPNYGVGGAPLTAYKWLMFFTGVDRPGDDAAASFQEQKIGLAGCLDDDLDTWAILNSDAPIYWSGLGTAGYPDGAPWCPTATYDAEWGGASRDPFVFTDGTDWYIIITAKQGGDTGSQLVGLAKFSGGTVPDFTDPEHNATAVMEADTGGLHCESPTLQLINGRWHFTFIGTGGTRHQSSTTHPTSSDFNNSIAAGVVINNSGPQVGLANEVFQVDGDTYYCSGHIDQGGDYPNEFYSYVLNLLDFSDLNAHVDGLYPTETPLHSIAGLRGLREGVLDLTLTWSIIDSEGAAGAFYRQPVWGDQAASAEYGASGMTGDSYIATLFKHWHPGADMDGDEWPDNTKVGAIQSANFTITRNRFSLMVGGGNHASTEFVALCRADDDTIIHSETGADSHVMTERLWDTSGLVGLEVYLVVVDNETGSWGNISVDHIREYQETDLGDGARLPLPNGADVTGLTP